MESILSLIQKFKSGDPNASTQILERMTPLVRKYASKIYCMEYEDALQELYIALLKSLPYLNPSEPVGKCLGYMVSSVVNCYKALCKQNLSRMKTVDIDTYYTALEAPSVIDESYYDIVSFINALPPKSLKQEILSLYFYEDMTDTEIAEKLKVSRQYVNLSLIHI